MRLNPILGTTSRKIYALAGAITLLLALYRVTSREVRAGSQSDVDRQQPASSEPLVIQGRITGITRHSRDRETAGLRASSTRGALFFVALTSIWVFAGSGSAPALASP